MIDVSSIVESNSDKIEAIEVLEPKLFRIILKGSGPAALLVRVRGSKSHGFTPELSHHVHASRTMGPHHPSFHSSESLLEALEEAIIHGLMFYNPVDDGAVWEANRFFR